MGHVFAATDLGDPISSIAVKVVSRLVLDENLMARLRREEGAGIPPARLAKVFDPFYARDTIDTLGGGRLLPPLPGKSSLGLSAVYGLIASMGGKVEIASEVGKGTVVSIIMPSRRARAIDQRS